MPEKIIKTFTGTVVRKSGDKTVAVEVRTVRQHPRYHKTVKRAKKFLAHDPKNAATVGQVVQIREVRPLSKRKRWLVIYDS